MGDYVLNTKSEISLNTALDDIEEWNSLSFIILLSMAKEHGFTKINSTSVNEAQTVGDLYELIK